MAGGSRWAARPGWTRGGIDIDVTGTRPHGPRPRAPDPQGRAGGWGWPLIHHPAPRVEVRPTAAGGKTIHVHMTTSG
ncbi:hypothetical protein ACIRBY_16055 [Streptomyces sp. NPDC096136]|uniref:hypothetical protein n=1 Tax=Streptomyces sp. NPDC096136 TaxID=3366076 RepID=UPI0038051984